MHLLWAGMGEVLPTTEKVRMLCSCSYFLSVCMKGTTQVYVLTFQSNPLMFQILYFMIKFITNKFTWNYLPKEQRLILVVSRFLTLGQQEI